MVFGDPRSRRTFVRLLAETARRHRWHVAAYCVLGNHVHLIVRLEDPNLSEGMQQLQSRYARWRNRIDGRTNHVFGGRFRSSIIADDAYLMQAVTYVLRNPVAAGLVDHAAHWPESSYRATFGMGTPPPWLDIDLALGSFHPIRTHARRLLDLHIRHDRTGGPSQTPTAHQLVLALEQSAAIDAAIDLGRTRRDIAHALGISPAALSQRLDRRR